MAMKAPPASRKFKIYRDEIKLAHTGHWDLDYLSQAELDALMTPKCPADLAAEQTPYKVPGKPEPKP